MCGGWGHRDLSGDVHRRCRRFFDVRSYRCGPGAYADSDARAPSSGRNARADCDANIRADTHADPCSSRRDRHRYSDSDGDTDGDSCSRNRDLPADSDHGAACGRTGPHNHTRGGASGGGRSQPRVSPRHRDRLGGGRRQWSLLASPWEVGAGQVTQQLVGITGKCDTRWEDPMDTDLACWRHKATAMVFTVYSYSPPSPPRTPATAAGLG